MAEKEKIKLSITMGSWVRAALVVALGYAFFHASDLILVLIASIIIASAIEPLSLVALKQGIPRLPSVVLVYVLTALSLSVFFYFLLLPLIGEVTVFVKTLTIYSNSLANDSILSGIFQSQNVFQGIDTPAIMTELSGYLKSFTEYLSRGVFSTAAVVFGGVASFVLILVLSFYLAVQDDGVGKFLRVIVPVNHEAYVLGLWKRSQLKIGYWMQGQLLLGVIVGFLVYVSLVIIGVPLALLLAVLAAILEIIPLFGPIIAAIPTVFVAYAALGFTQAIITTGIFIIIQQLENHVLYPMVVKKVIGVPPIISILALVIGGELAGIMGVLVSVPVAVVLMEFISDLEQKKSVAAHSERS